MADEDLKVLLRENIEVSKESLKILKKINRGRIFGNVFSDLEVDAHHRHLSRDFYYIEPFLSKYLDTIKGLTSGVENVGKISNNINSATSPDLLKNCKT